jgi:hypothetical protein
MARDLLTLPTRILPDVEDIHINIDLNFYDLVLRHFSPLTHTSPPPLVRKRKMGAGTNGGKADLRATATQPP